MDSNYQYLYETLYTIFELEENDYKHKIFVQM